MSWRIAVFAHPGAAPDAIIAVGGLRARALTKAKRLIRSPRVLFWSESFNAPGLCACDVEKIYRWPLEPDKLKPAFFLEVWE